MINHVNMEIEKFIEKPIEELIHIGDIDKPSKKIDFSPELKNYGNLNLKSDEAFCEMSFNRLQIIFDDNQIIHELSTAFPVIVDTFFYNKMITHYGYPNTIQVIDKINEAKESENNIKNKDDFHQILKKHFITTKEGKFEDKPFWVLWKKENYDIKLMFYYKQNATQLTFRKPKADLF